MGASGGRRSHRLIHLPEEYGTMRAVLAPCGDAQTFLTHLVVVGLDEKRYVVQKFLAAPMTALSPFMPNSPTGRAGVGREIRSCR